MADFTSALYLGLQHPSGLLEPWSSLTRGIPEALRPSPGGRRLAARLAELVGCSSALLSPSTLHLFWDLFGMVATLPVAIYADAAVYPIVRWGLERAAVRGVPVRSFAHYDPVALWSALLCEPRRPLVVMDGFCTACGRLAPLADCLELIRRRDGLLLVDDTQALGVMGSRPQAAAPYGRGGGGSFRFAGVSGPDVIWSASLAKGFGVPIAAVAGSGEMIEELERNSETRVHCSPPSTAALRAAERALDVNHADGERRRGRLLERVRHFRKKLRERACLFPRGGLFPVQSLDLPSRPRLLALHRRLGRAGVQTVVRRGCTGSTQLCFVLTADHRNEQIDRALDELLLALDESDTVAREG